MTWETAAIGIIWGITLWVALKYFWMSSEAVIIMSIVLALDFIMGTLEVWLKRRNELSSTRAWQWLFRKITRWLLPFIIVIVIKWAWLENVWYLSATVCWIIILSEWYSILWHIYAINQPWDEQLPEVNALQYLIELISKMFKFAIENKTDVLHPNDKQDETKKRNESGKDE